MVKKPQKTAQRAAILDYLKDNKSHPSIKEIYQHVSDKIYNISLTTVYNTIDLLKEQGIVMELPIVIHGEGRRYDPNPFPHDHLICTSCGRAVDIVVGVDRSQLLAADQQQGFDIHKICINVFGQCAACKNMTQNTDFN